MNNITSTMAQFSILLADLKVYNHRRDGTLVLREDCVAELNNYIDPLPENLDGKLLTRILENCLYEWQCEQSIGPTLI
ncbi:hypothetical protein Bca52824_044286 [Brassica carinata]|uniref:Uncharacterized protein n=1 Tax=Brassica carinata TaxID=52824 RepID=A0A8X7V0G4_BRACI|nr:hypothetical protein Bca52824_044286 [Brassica carinata]